MEAEQTSVSSQKAVDSATKLYNAIQEGFPEAVNEFESSWAAARAVYETQCITPTKDNACTRTDQFDDVLENDPKYCPKLLGDENLSRSSRIIVELNYQRNKLFEEHVKAWKEYCDERSMCNHTNFLGMDEYLDLVEMGPSIIAHLMVEYRYSWGEAWFQLLHEINHGYQMVSIQYVPSIIFETWCRWFTYGDQFNAPEYIPTALDRKIFSRHYGKNPADGVSGVTG
ncbi:hypothetical protein F5Y09DRAFT_340446 [Xylaria sp. FL1042]|nr:hypothetical protein F5Y09DRAFT_340446 [Xylaria sp. FL1042]